MLVWIDKIVEAQIAILDRSSDNRNSSRTARKSTSPPSEIEVYQSFKLCILLLLSGAAAEFVEHIIIPIVTMAPIQKHLETDLENVHSLPGLEEARTQNIMAGGGNKYSGKKKRTIALIVVLVVVIATAVGFSIAATQNKRGQSEAKSLTGNENDDTDDTDDTGGDDENQAEDDETDVTDDQETDDDERFPQVISFLTSGAVSSSSDLQNTASAQYKAATWISNDDERQLDIPETMDEEDSFKFVQRYVMAVFYFALNGPNWTRQVGFLSGEATCDWNFDLEVSDNIDGSDQRDYDYGVSCWDEESDEYFDTVTWIFMRKFTLTLKLRVVFFMVKTDILLLFQS